MVAVVRRKISAERVRYIKLGKKGSWEQECLASGTIRLGFNTARCFQTVINGRWGSLKKAFLREGKSSHVAAQFVNQCRSFFEDDGSILWLTFMANRLYWGFVDTSAPEPHPDGKGTFRKIRGGWSSESIQGDTLTKDKLSGALLKVSAFQGTSCEVKGEVADYVIRKINGERLPEVDQAAKDKHALQRSLIRLMKLLTPQDFELLVDLVFSDSGWQRQGVVGKTEKTLDLDLILPTTGERAFVQIKSKTNQAEFEKYLSEFVDLPDFVRMFYVYHSGQVEFEREKISVIGPEKLSEMVIDAGLASWLIRKTS